MTDAYDTRESSADRALLARLEIDAEALLAHVAALHPEATVVVFDTAMRMIAAAGADPFPGGGRASDLVGRTLDDVATGAVYLFLQRLYRATLAGEAASVEFTSESSGRVYRQRATPLRDVAGAVVAGLTLWEDISERRRVERELVQSEARHRLIADRSSDIIVVLDSELRYEYVSPAMERITGWSRHEQIGLSVLEFVHPGDIATIVGRNDAVRAGATHGPVEYRYRRRDGGYVWLEGVLSAFTDDATGAVTGYQASGRDITERKRAEDLFRAVAASAPVGIFRTDPAGRCTYVNARWTEITGIPGERALGDGWQDSIHPDDREPSVVSWADSSRGKESALTYRVLRPDGGIRHVATAAVPLHDESGEQLGWVGSVTDVTQIVEAEASLRQIQRHESLAVLAGGVAHDFNNLLVGVLGNAALALAELPADAPARHSVEQVVIAARRAADLTRQMLAYSGRGHFVIERYDLGELVGELARLLESAVGPDVAIQLERDETLPQLEGDATQIRQVVLNLIVNAAESIGGGRGVVTVAVRGTELAAADRAGLVPGTEIEPGSYVALTVRDHGSGMDEATVARMFEPFFSTKFTGRGLGLAATLGIVRGHRGGLRVESAPGQGTTISVYLPPAPAQALPSPPAGVGAAERSGGTVLVVDDDRIVRTVTVRMLETAGLEVDAVESGAAAVAALEAAPSRYDVVLLDVSMPGLAGAELVAALTSVAAGVRILVISGHSSEDALARVGRSGSTAFLQKPYAPTDLVAAVHAALAG